jgi:SAM-dependent methyltransferase
MSVRPHGIYRLGIAPLVYDLVANAMFAPLGGLRRLRESAIDRMGDLQGKTVLELGCGSGAVTRLLARRGAAVTGVDAAETMLRRAHMRAPDAKFVRARLEALPELGMFDVVLCCFVLHELREAGRAGPRAPVALAGGPADDRRPCRAANGPFRQSLARPARPPGAAKRRRLHWPGLR